MNSTGRRDFAFLCAVSLLMSALSVIVSGEWGWRPSLSAISQGDRLWTEFFSNRFRDLYEWEPRDVAS